MERGIYVHIPFRHDELIFAIFWTYVHFGLVHFNHTDAANLITCQWGDRQDHRLTGIYVGCLIDRYGTAYS